MSVKKYQVGFGKPPKEHQFRPGQSGNPKGRPKDARNLATDLKEELEEKIVVTEGGRQKEMSKQRAMVKTLVAKALKGDTRAAQTLITLKLGVEQAESDRPGEEILPADDKALLEQFFAHRAAQSPKEEP